MSMSRARHYRLMVNVVLMALLFGTSPRHTGDPRDHAFNPNLFGANEASGEGLDGEFLDAPPFQRDLFQAATELNRSLHERSQESRTATDYRRTMDAYDKVTRMGADEGLAARSLAQGGDLMREMADAAGDYALYNKAIENFRRIVKQYPQSNYVGYSLISIAQIYEQSLQDLDGAASAYRDVVDYFPNSVLAREAGAILVRYESELSSSRHSPDVLVDDRSRTLAGRAEGAPGQVLLNNVRNFAGPDYARVVIDLSDGTGFQANRSGANRIVINMAAAVARTLDGRRFIIRDSRFLKHITVSEPGTNGAIIELEANGLASYTAFELSSPARLVIDLHSTAGMTPEVEVARAAAARSVARSEPVREAISAAAPERPAYQPRSSSGGGAILSLPDVDVSNLDKIAASESDHKPGATPAATVTIDSASRPPAPATAQDQRAPVDPPVRCIVIDPGHGGHDTGTIGEGGLKEKDLVLDVGRKLRDDIRRNFPGIEVVMTRDSDRFVALEERTAIANAKRADLFISIHANAAPTHVASGVETYFLSPDRASAEDLKAAQRENSTLGGETPHAAGAVSRTPGQPTPGVDPGDKLRSVVASVSAGNRITESRELASYIQSGLVRGIGSAAPRTAANRGVKHAPFVVLLGASMPSVLAEISFVSNPRDEDLLRTDQFRGRIAASLFAGLRAYLKKSHPAPAASANKSAADSEHKPK
jgi:N-acetylmuramoyl-L-alanine amidase